jgi:hypothetical protein
VALGGEGEAQRVRVLFDADSMVYGCGFAAQKTLYDWTASNGTDVEEGIAADRENLTAVQSLLPEGWTLEYTTVAEAEPLENALALAKRQCYGVEERLERDGMKFERMELFLTGKGNHRDAIAQVRPYKGNRIGMEKPVHYQALRRYLRERWGAKVISGREADDEVAIISAAEGHDPERVLIVSQDKDLRTVPGLLYNYRRKSYELITPKLALVNFYRQILTGDLTDNIVGCCKVGETKAAKIITEDMDEVAMYAAVLREFAASIDRKGCEYAARDPESVVIEFGQLLHMQRSENDLWQPPTTRPALL